MHANQASRSSQTWQATPSVFLRRTAPSSTNQIYGNSSDTLNSDSLVELAPCSPLAHGAGIGGPLHVDAKGKYSCTIKFCLISLTPAFLSQPPTLIDMALRIPGLTSYSGSVCCTPHLAHRNRCACDDFGDTDETYVRISRLSIRTGPYAHYCILTANALTGSE